jgi:hypothetical protein
VSASILAVLDMLAKCDGGAILRNSDIAALGDAAALIRGQEAEIQRLTAALARAHAAESHAADLAHREADNAERREKAEQALATARGEALREAAGVCDALAAELAARADSAAPNSVGERNAVAGSVACGRAAERIFALLAQPAADHPCTGTSCGECVATGRATGGGE